MILRYRVLPRCYGYFNLLGERIVAAEIEEICVGNNTLSFEDYIQCRRLHLNITIFYNDGLFQTLLMALRRWSISPFEWMEMIYDTEMHDGLGQVFKSFEQATKDELWEQRENLAEFIQEPENVEKFISGELGNNLLFVHKTKAIIEHSQELASLARRTVLCLLEKHEKLDDAAREFFNECVDYHLLRQTKIFEGRNEEVIGRFTFDIHGFEEDSDPGNPESYRFKEPKDIRFILDDSQRDLVSRYVDIYGDDVVGIGRILSKVYVKKLFRHPIVEDESVTPESTIKMHIAGLQN